MSSAVSTATPQWPDLAERQRAVGVEAHQGRHVEGHREAVLTLGEEMAEPPIGVGDPGEPGELADGPRLAPVPGGVDAAGVGEPPGIADALGRFRPSAGSPRAGTSSNDRVTKRSRRFGASS